jgi:hypothetical protein
MCPTKKVCPASARWPRKNASVVRTCNSRNISSSCTLICRVAMDKLPQELVNRIVWFAERYPGQDQWFPAIGQYSGESPSEFPRLAGLNHVWKEAVETITFHSLKIRSNELDTLQSIITKNRRKYLSRINFTALLPEYSYEACGRTESRVEQHLNDKAFTKGISDLFGVLKAWENDSLQNALALHIESPESPTDNRISGPEANALRDDIAIRKSIDISYNRWKDSVLHFRKPDMLPTLFNIQHLHIQGNSSRQLASHVAPDLAISLPNLNNVHWMFPGFDLELPPEDSDSDSSSELDSIPDSAAPATRRREDRIVFADTLVKIQPQPRSTVYISFYHCSPFDQRPKRPSVVPPGLTYDPFSSAIRIFSQNATNLDLDAQLDSSLFRPSPDERNSTVPAWPHLKKLDVKLSIVTPSGDWYFTGPCPVSHEDDDPARGDVGGDVEPGFSYAEFRAHPDPETFDPFLAAFAKSVARMPILESFMLTCELSHPTGKLHISYDAPGIKSDWGGETDEELACRRVYYACEAGKTWLPEPETAECLRSAGSEKFGGEVLEKFVGSLYY